MSKQRERKRGILGLIDGEEDQSQSPSHLETVELAKPAIRHMASGSIKTLESTLTRAEREAEELRSLLESGAKIVELKASLVRPSPYADRMKDDDVEAFQTLKTSIAEDGQQVPILVRPHPSELDQYEVAYGHRRLRAVAELGLPVRAIIKSLTDEQLVLAQGIENSARQDLSWIEQAVFALKLDERGFNQKAIAGALSIQRTNTNTMIQVVRKIPADIIQAIGRAPKVGRPRWVELADSLVDGVPQTVRTVLASPVFSSLPSDERFETILRALNAREGEREAVESQAKQQRFRQTTATLAVSGGRTVGSFMRGPKTATLKLEDVDFGAWLAERVPALHAEFTATTELPTPHPESAYGSSGSAINASKE